MACTEFGAGRGAGDACMICDVCRCCDAVTTYADGVHASYEASLDSATTMDAAIDAFIADPNDDTLEACRS